MKPIDLSGLIKGVMVVIAISLALGKYSQLIAWARREALGVPVKNTERIHRDPSLGK